MDCTGRIRESLVEPAFHCIPDQFAKRQIGTQWNASLPTTRESAHCTQPRNLILTSVVLIAGVSGALVKVGTVELKGMAMGTVVAIVLSLTFGLTERFRRLS